MKKIVLLTVMIVLFSATSLFAQCTTFVSGGTIDGESWTQAGSPYCINGNITIANLAIESGVKVEFLDDYQFYVQPDGVLTAIGSEENEIEFIRNEINGNGWQGINFDNSSSASELTYCTIQGSINSGLRIIESTPTIENCTITGNDGSTGAGIYISLTTDANDELIITDCDISANDSIGGGGGIMAVVEQGSLTLSGCKIQNNYANPSLAEGEYNGGGFNGNVGLYGNVLLDKCKIVGNTNQSYCSGWNCSRSAKGGGIYKTGLGYLTLESTIVKENLSYVTEGGIGGQEHVYSYGGGIFVEEGGLTATNSIIFSNVARAYGADAYGYGGGGHVSSGLIKLINCTISYNSAEAPGYGRLYAYGGGLSKAVNSNMILTNSIVYFNEKNVGGIISYSQINGDPTVTYSDIQGGYPGEGNIDDDPLFIGGANYHLTTGSPCIDTGTNDAPDLPDTDIDDDPRIIDGDNNGTQTVDMGADEYNRDELAVDFGTNGLWHYDGSAWTSLAGWDPDGKMVDRDNGLAVDFGSYGLWNYDGSSWSNLAGWNPSNLQAYSNGIAVDFGTYGLWSYDGSSWTSLASWNPDGMVDWTGGLAVNFGATYGLWNYDGSSWSNLAGWDAEYGIAWNNGLAVDFGSNGLWYYRGTSWTSLAGWNPDGMVEWTGGLAVDFDTYGTWNYDGTTWTQLAAWNPEGDMVSWTNGIAVDFGSNGLWSYDGSSWTSLATWNPEEMGAWVNGLAVDFGASYGLWNYHGSSWTSLAGWDSEDIIDVDLY